MNIAFIYAVGRLQRLESVRAGQSASEFFYGSEELRKAGHDVTLYEVSPNDTKGLGRAIVDFLFSKGLLPNRTRGWVLLGVRKWLAALNRHDVVVATSTGLAFSLAIWQALGLLKIPIVAIHCGIFNYQPNWLRRRQIRFLLRRMWSVVFGEAECPIMRQLFGISAERLQVNHFGVDERFWSPAEKPAGGEPFLLAVGNDSRRDYALLVKAAAELPARVDILTRLEVNVPLPSNVRVFHSSWHKEALSDQELRELYRKCIAVVVPLVETVQPSGQSVTLQAMACGRPVVLTRVQGLWSKEDMRDGENVLLVPPGDENALRSAMKSLIDDPAKGAALGAAARRTVENCFRIESFAARLGELCRVAVGGAT